MLTVSNAQNFRRCLVLKLYDGSENVKNGAELLSHASMVGEEQKKCVVSVIRKKTHAHCGGDSDSRPLSRKSDA